MDFWFLGKHLFMQHELLIEVKFPNLSNSYGRKNDNTHISFMSVAEKRGPDSVSFSKNSRAAAFKAPLI